MTQTVTPPIEGQDIDRKAMQARIETAAGKALSFVDCDFQDADFSRLELRGFQFSGCAIAGASFQGADLTDSQWLRLVARGMPAGRRAAARRVVSQVQSAAAGFLGR